jgi:hypothetical protein
MNSIRTPHVTPIETQAKQCNWSGDEAHCDYPRKSREAGALVIGDRRCIYFQQIDSRIRFFNRIAHRYQDNRVRLLDLMEIQPQ